MSTNTGSSNRTLLDAINTVSLCLSDPNLEIEDGNRTKLTDTFHQLQRRLHSTTDQPDSNITTDDCLSNLSRTKMCHQLEILNDCSIIEPRLVPTLRDLEPERQQALSCFFLFEKGAVMKKKDLIYWWVGYKLIDVNDGKDAWEAADVILQELVEAGAIEQVNSSKYRLTTISRQQHQSKGEKYNNLVGMFSKQGSKLILTSPYGTTINKNSQESTEILFNPGVSVLNIERDWLRKMKNLKVLHLGRWSNNPEQHIEVEKVEFLAGLKYLKKVRFISFKGISRIIQLADELCRLGDNLKILDLQACPNLEVLPKEIGKLKNLTHLDLSECYLLDHITKGITSLEKLQVLEGFVIADVDSSSSCKFKDLGTHLGTSLRKLSIRARKVSFPVEDDLKAFAKFVKLLKLKIVWINIPEFNGKKTSEKTEEAELKTKDGLHSGSSVKSLAMTSCGEANPSGLPQQLEKLEVQAIPQSAVKNLIMRNNTLENLKKLCILGGEVYDLTNHGQIKWKIVEILRLKHLANLHMNWRQFKVAFPHVSYLQMIRCPNLSLFPCDQNGIWENSLV